jgi:hypothetical protein
MYEVKTAVFVIQNCLKKGLGLQCTCIIYLELDRFLKIDFGS